MLRVVSVQTDLQDIKAHLASCGYQVVDMENCSSPIEAIVYQGAALGNMDHNKQAKNTMVINAAGLTAMEVAQQLEDRI